MKKNRLGFMALSMLSVVAFATSCGGTSSFVPPTPEDAVGDWTTVKKTYLDETDIGTNLDITDGKLAGYTAADNPLKIGLVTDSGTLNDHSFNESAWKGVNEFAMENGDGGTLSEKGVQNGTIQTYYVQPTPGQYTAAGRLEAMRSVVKWGADVIVLPGYLFQGAIALALKDPYFDNVAFLALDCAETDDDRRHVHHGMRIPDRRTLSAAGRQPLYGGRGVDSPLGRGHAHHLHLLSDHRLPDGGHELLHEHRHGRQGHLPVAVAAAVVPHAVPDLPAAHLRPIYVVGRQLGRLGLDAALGSAGLDRRLLHADLAAALFPQTAGFRTRKTVIVYG